LSFALQSYSLFLFQPKENMKKSHYVPTARFFSTEERNKGDSKQKTPILQNSVEQNIHGGKERRSFIVFE